jgi:hypothetical protein
MERVSTHELVSEMLTRGSNSDDTTIFEAARRLEILDRQASEGVVSAVATERRLAAKLADVMRIVANIPKNGVIRGEGYSYPVVLAGDVFDKIRPELAQRNIVIFPRALDSKREGGVTEVMVEYLIEDGETGEQRIVRVPGQGQDPKSDKGAAKAMTAATKSMLLALLLVSSETEGAARQERQSAAKQPPREEASAPPKDTLAGRLAIMSEKVAKDRRKYLQVKIGFQKAFVWEAKEGQNRLDLLERVKAVQGRDVVVKLAFDNGYYHVTELLEVKA